MLSFFSKHHTWAGAWLAALFVILSFILRASISRADTVTATIPMGIQPVGVVVNPVTNKIYVSNALSDSVTVIDGATNATTTIAVGDRPYQMAVNPATNKVYVLQYGDVLTTSNALTVIDGATNLTNTITVGTNPWVIAVNPVTNKIYVTSQGLWATGDETLTVIDGSSGVTTTVLLGTHVWGLAVNPATNIIYATTGNQVAVVDGESNSIVTVTVGIQPQAIVVNPVTNKIYIAYVGQSTLYPSGLTVMNGNTNITATISSTVPLASLTYSLALNPATNKIYVTNYSDGNATIIDGTTDVATIVDVLTATVGVAANPLTDKTYFVAPGRFSSWANKVVMLNGTSGLTETLDVGLYPANVAINPVTNRIYVTNGGDHINNNPGSVTVIDGGVITNTPALPLAVSISPLSGDATLNPTPTFTFTVTSLYTDTLPVRNVYYQVDTKMGQWFTTTVSGPNWVITLPTLAFGAHTLYAFATDGQEATLSNTGFANASSPIVGPVAAYPFTMTSPFSVFLPVIRR